MNWTSWSDFAAMGGYAVYVWGAFGMVGVVIAGEVLQLAARRRALVEADGQGRRGELSNEA